MSRAPEFLPAKKLRQDRNLTLAQHLGDTEQAAVALFGPGRRWGVAFSRFFRLGSGGYEPFLLNLRLAALFHDIGKANGDFVRAMVATGFERQTLRHEHISALVLHLPSVRQWLSQHRSVDVEAITGAVLSHHLKAEPKHGQKFRWGQPRSDQRRVDLHLEHPEITATLLRVAEVANLSSPPPKLPTDPLIFEASGIGSPWTEALQQGFRTAETYRRKLRKDQPRRAMLLATKAGLIAADSVASALFREQRPIDEWVGEVMGPALTSDLIAEAIIEPRLRSIGPEAKLKDFQVAVSSQGSRALLLAACGSGKTLAAWAWARAQLATADFGRVIFLYPTRGTATEGFRDYVGWAPEGEGGLLHGTATYELVDMAKNPPESVEGKRLYDEADERLFALAHWGKRYFSATVDQFLSFLEHQYRGLCMVPLIADAAIVIDEVHSYDEVMFRGLLSFLDNFEGPVLCMTATLPQDRRDALAAKGLRVFPGPQDKQHIEALRRAETAPRYRIEPVHSPEAAVEEACAAYRARLRVLYVVNTVQRCQEAADRLEARLGEPVLAYHSRFRLIDRKQAHQATVEAFQQKAEPAIAVTTQVCEMSLDLDADVLITEHAPVTSLVQRFGRANRKGLIDFARLITYPPPSRMPYQQEDLRAAAEFVDELQDRHLSQADLAAALLRFAGERPRPDEYASFVTSGYFAMPETFREIDDITESAILDADLLIAVGLQAQRKPWEQYLLPVPRRRGLTEDPPAELPPYVRVAPSSHYTTERGFVLDGESK